MRNVQLSLTSSAHRTPTSSAPGQRSIRLGRASVLSFALLLSLGCSTGQIGGEVENDDGGGTNAEGDQCEEVGSEAIGASDTTPLGSTPSEVAATFEGTHEATLAWGDNGNGLSAEVTPEAGESTITITVDVDEASAVWVDNEPAEVEGGGTLAEIETQPCRDELRFDATVTVSTGNGALDETLEATFSTVDGTLVSTRIPLSKELNGSFSVDVSELPNAKSNEYIDIAFVLGTMSGEVSGFIESNDGESVSQGAASAYGRFPIESCEYGYLVDPESEWAEALEGEITAHTNFTLAWDGGTSTTIALTPTLGDLCYQDDPYGTETTLTFEMSADVVAADGSIDGTWPLSANVTLNADGSLGEISVYRDNYIGQSYSVDSFAAATGIQGIESDADALGFQFGYIIYPGSENPTYGSMAILEMSIPECAQEGYEPEVTEDSEGGGAPGCEGIDFTESATATLTEIAPAE